MIRCVVAGDLKDCLEIMHKGYRTVADEFGLTDDNCPDSGGATFQYESLLFNYNSGNNMYAYFLDEKPVGFLEFYFLESTIVKLTNIVILPEYRGMGIGTELLNFVKKFCIDNGFRKLTLGMIDDNTRLKNWYLGHGFIESRKIKYPKAPFTAGYMEMIFQ